MNTAARAAARFAEAHAPRVVCGLRTIVLTPGDIIGRIDAAIAIVLGFVLAFVYDDPAHPVSNLVDRSIDARRPAP